MSSSIKTDLQKPKGLGGDIEVHRIPIEKIKIGKDRRPLDQKNVTKIAVSMKSVGQLAPVIARRLDNGIIKLVSGLHRLEAAKSLGNSKINAVIIEAGLDEARICEDVENLHRMDLRALVKAERIDRIRRMLVRRARENAEAAGGKQPKDKAINKTARLLGIHKREVQRSMIISKIDSDAKTAATVQGLDNKQNALLAIAEQRTVKAQLEKIKELANEKTARASVRARGNGAREMVTVLPEHESPSISPIEQEEAEFKALKKLFNRSSHAAQKRFVSYLKGRKNRKATVLAD
jgi:ParB family chromosome partitioning protein